MSITTTSLKVATYTFDKVTSMPILKIIKSKDTCTQWTVTSLTLGHIVSIHFSKCTASFNLNAKTKVNSLLYMAKG